MKKSIADRWVKALRSGEFKQGREYLKKDNKYCCLGVLAEIQGLKSKCENLLDCENSPLKNMDGAIDDASHFFNSLAGLNDSDYTFDEIADVIQMTWEEL